MTLNTNVLRYLLENRGAELSIRQMARATRTDYKNLYLAVRRLEREGAVNVETFGHSKRITLSGRISPLLICAEIERRNDILANKDLAVMLDQLLKDLGTTLCILLLFGSHAKRTQRKGSDIDLMLIVPDGKEEEFEKAVHRSLAILPLPVHALVFTESQFREMLSSKGPNVGKEAAARNIILHNIESYYELRGHD